MRIPPQSSAIIASPRQSIRGRSIMRTRTCAGVSNFQKHLIKLLLLFSLSLFAAQARAQVAFDAAASNGAFDPVALTSLTWSHTVGANTNRFLVVGVSTFTNTPVPAQRVTGVTYNGTPMTRIATQLATDNQSAIEMFQLLNPPSGTANVVVSLTAVNYAVGGSASFSNVNQSTPTGSPQTNSGNGTTLPNVTVTSSASDMVIDTVGTSPAGGFLAPSASQTERWNGSPFFSNSFSVGAGSTRTGAAPSVTMTWLMSNQVPWAIGAVSILPQTTAADSSVSGSIRTSSGAPVAGATITLTGAQTRTTITDAAGNYHFDNVETGGFYAITPERANYTFSPAARSFSLTGNRTDALFTGEAGEERENPLETPEYFVRQQYLDFLGREPDEGGLNFWARKLRQCADSACLARERINVSAAFFMSDEFQKTTSFVYRLYSAALGRQLSYAEFTVDRSRVVDGSEIESRKEAFLLSLVRRDEFLQKYAEATSAESFVDALTSSVKQASGVDLSDERAALIAAYNSESESVNEARALVLREVVEDARFREATYNRAFVLTEYYGYLRRDMDAGGYEFWLNVLNERVTGNYRSMVCAFLTSTEYQRRFGSVVTHSNSECGQ